MEPESAPAARQPVVYNALALVGSYIGYLKLETRNLRKLLTRTGSPTLIEAKQHVKFPLRVCPITGNSFPP